MVHACTAKMAKFVVFGVNFLLGALGAALLAVGIWTKVDNNIGKVLTFLPNISWISTIAIVVGAIIFLIGFCGCFGAVCEITWLLLVYEVLMFILVVIELCALVAFIFLGAGAESLILDGAKQVIKNIVGKPEGIDREITNLIYGVQFEFHCCGVEGYEDYNNSYYQNAPSSDSTTCSAVPITCCERYTTDGNWTHPYVKDQAACCDKQNFSSPAGRNKQGCLKNIAERVLEIVPFGALIAIPIIAVSAIALQILVLLATMGLWCAVNEAQSVKEQMVPRGAVYQSGVAQIRV